MNNRYISEANRFFIDSSEEMDPDAAIFIKFHQDPAFWLWFGAQLTELTVLRDEGEDLVALAIINRYLHGLICADLHLGEGVVISAMANVLSHTPDILSAALTAPPLSLKKALEDDIGPHSGYASSRLLTYLWKALGDQAPSVLQSLVGIDVAHIQPMVLSAALGDPYGRSLARDSDDAQRRTALSIRMLTAIQTSSLPGGPRAFASEVLTEEVVSSLSCSEFVSWPEWQLLPLLEGGIERAVELGVDIFKASETIPVGGKEAAIWSVIFSTAHPASSDRLTRFICDELIPHGNPEEIMKGIWSLGTYMGEQWLPGYIEANREAFWAATPPSEHNLSGLLRWGISKKIVLSHPDFSAKEKGKILSDDLGM